MRIFFDCLSLFLHFSLQSTLIFMLITFLTSQSIASLLHSTMDSTAFVRQML